MSVPGLLGHAELVPPGVGEERAAGALRGEAGLGPGLAALHLEGAVLCSQQEGTPGQGGGDTQQQQPGPHLHNCSRRCTRTGLEVQQHCFCTWQRSLGAVLCLKDICEVKKTMGSIFVTIDNCYVIPAVSRYFSSFFLIFNVTIIHGDYNVNIPYMHHAHHQWHKWIKLIKFKLIIGIYWIFREQSQVIANDLDK